MGNFTKRTIAITAAVAALGAAGVAFAAWTTNGSGTGTATAGNSTPLTITQTGTATGLFPTGSVNVPFTVKNDNQYGVLLSGATASNFATTTPGCNATSLSGAALTLTDVIAAGATSSAKNMVVSMNNTAADACQGATFTFTITVNGMSN